VDTASPETAKLFATLALIAALPLMVTGVSLESVPAITCATLGAVEADGRTTSNP